MLVRYAFRFADGAGATVLYKNLPGYDVFALYRLQPCLAD